MIDVAERRNTKEMKDILTLKEAAIEILSKSKNGPKMHYISIYMEKD